MQNMSETGDILITGDTHREDIPSRFSTSNIKKVCGDSIPNVAIVLGDFGLPWSNDPENGTDKYLIETLNRKVWTTLAVGGNHENYGRIYSSPLVPLYGGMAYKISDSIYYLQHGHIFTIENKTFFVFGGALSIDKAYRKDRVSWWEEEIPSASDFYRAMTTLEKADYKVDYILSHTGPTEAIKAIRESFQDQLLLSIEEANDKENRDYAALMLDKFLDRVTFKHWYFGHFHMNESFQLKADDNGDVASFTTLYDKSVIV
jgi:hypothetical protein